MEIRSNNVELRADANAITGYAARYYDPYEAGTEYELIPGMLWERVSPGAFEKDLKEGRDIAALYSHDPSMILGKTSAGTLDIATDSKGLKFSIKFDKTDPDHKRLAAKVRSKSITGASFGFVVRKERYVQERGKDVRYLDEVQLVEISPTPFPAYAGTKTKFRSEHLADVEDTYKRWKETQARLERMPASC